MGTRIRKNFDLQLSTVNDVNNAFDQYHILLNHPAIVSSVIIDRRDAVANTVLSSLFSLIYTQFKHCYNKKKRYIAMLVHGLMLELFFTSDKMSESVLSDHNFTFNMSYTN